MLQLEQFIVHNYRELLIDASYSGLFLAIIL